MWATILGIIGPLLLGLAGFVGGGGTRLSKKIAHHADLVEKLKGADAAQKALQTLLEKEVEWLMEDETLRRNRKVNVGVLILAVGLGASVAALSYFSFAAAAQFAAESAGLHAGAISLFVVGGITPILMGFFLSHTLPRLLWRTTTPS